MRFSTAELSDLAGRISRAEEASQTREMELYRELCLRVEAVMSLTESAALAIADAMTGGSVQTGLSGGFTAYPERIGDR